MLRADLHDALTAEQRKAGLSLEEREGHLVLMWEGHALAVFDSETATIQEIRRSAERHLRMKTE